MAIDLITGHQGVSHISADQIATINNAMMDNFGANKVMRLVGGELTADGLTITISEGYWRVNGFDMEIQEGETLYIDPTTIGLSRIDDIYVEILQDIPTGAQRAEIYIALGEPSATPTAPDEPTAPYLNTDILLQIIKLARVTVSEGAMIMEDYSVAYNIVTPEDLAEVQTEVDTAENHATTALNQIADSDDTYSPSKAYKVGEHCIYNNVLYKCITACSAAAWSVNQNCFEPTTLTTAVTELNSDLNRALNWTLAYVLPLYTASLNWDLTHYQEVKIVATLNENTAEYTIPASLIRDNVGFKIWGGGTVKGDNIAGLLFSAYVTPNGISKDQFYLNTDISSDCIIYVYVR